MSFETVREILAIDPAAVILTMSGRDEVGDYREVARRLGARRGFEKPVLAGELIGAITEALSCVALALRDNMRIRDDSSCERSDSRYVLITRRPRKSPDP